MAAFNCGQVAQNDRSEIAAVIFIFDGHTTLNNTGVDRFIGAGTTADDQSMWSDEFTTVTLHFAVNSVEIRLAAQST